MEEKDIIYFTKEQLKEIYEFQTEKDKLKLQEYLKGKDIDHIDVVQFVEMYLFGLPDDIWNLYLDFVIMLEKKEYEKEGKEWNVFKEISEHSKFTEEQIAEIQRIDTMTEAELDEYIKDVKFCESNLDDLKNKAVTF